MKEYEKIREASFFLNKLKTVPIANVEEMGYYFSAFLSAARSVIQYALEEMETDPAGKAWYNALKPKTQTFTFLKDMRDANIHRQEPAHVSQDVTVTVGHTLLKSGQTHSRFDVRTAR